MEVTINKEITSFEIKDLHKTLTKLAYKKTLKFPAILIAIGLIMTFLGEYRGFDTQTIEEGYNEVIKQSTIITYSYNYHFSFGLGIGLIVIGLYYILIFYRSQKAIMKHISPTIIPTQKLMVSISEKGIDYRDYHTSLNQKWICFSSFKIMDNKLFLFRPGELYISLKIPIQDLSEIQLTNLKQILKENIKTKS